MTQHRDVTLETIGNGSLGELFAAELARVLDNIADPNTDQKTKRVITLQVSFKPGRDRDVADVELKCSSKLAGINSVNALVYIGRRDGKVVAVEDNVKQAALFDDPNAPARPLAAVVNLNTNKGAGE